MKNKYTFVQQDDGRVPVQVRQLECPDCREILTQPDIEVFNRCPFCNYRFELNFQIEDFILEPIAENWARQQNIQISTKAQRFF